MTTHPYDDIEAFALGALDEETSRWVLAHADNCAVCAAALSQAMRTVEQLEPRGTLELAGTGVRAADVPFRSVPFERATKLWRAAAVACAAAACVAILWSFNTVRSIRSTTAVELAVPIASLVHSHFTHHALHGPVGNAKVIQALDGSWIYLVADDLAANTQYELLEVTQGQTVRIGEGVTDASGQIAVFWKQPPRHIDRFQLNVAGANLFTPGSSLQWP